MGTWTNLDYVQEIMAVKWRNKVWERWGIIFFGAADTNHGTKKKFFHECDDILS